MDPKSSIYVERTLYTSKIANETVSMIQQRFKQKCASSLSHDLSLQVIYSSCKNVLTFVNPVIVTNKKNVPNRGFYALTTFLCFQKHAKGQELFAKVCDHLNLLEKDYYGLAIWETPTIKVPQSVSAHSLTHSHNVHGGFYFLDKACVLHVYFTVWNVNSFFSFFLMIAVLFKFFYN